jgi:hypothetical protein
MISNNYYYNQGKVNLHNATFNILFTLHISYWLLTIPITEIQLIIFKREIFGLREFLIAEMILFILYYLTALGDFKVSKYYKCFIYYLLFIIFNSLFLTIRENATLYNLFDFISSKCFLVIILIFAINEVRNLEFGKIIKPIKLIAYSNMIFVFLQWLTKSIIWPYTVDSNNNELFFSVDYYNQEFYTRCPGLMSSGLASGYLLVLLFCIIIIESKKIIEVKTLISLSLCLLGIYLTGTRNIYILLCYIIGYYFVYQIYKKRKYYSLVIKMFTYTSVITIIYFLVLYIISKSIAINRASLLISTGSVHQRFFYWNYAIESIKSKGLLSIFFGQMMWQSSSRNMFSDNLYIDQVLAMGVIGLVGYLVVNFYLHAKLLKYPNKSSIILAAYLSGILIIGIANVPGMAYESLAILLTGIFIYKQRNENLLTNDINASSKMKKKYIKFNF